ncbi:hypothetical protein RA264_29210, partial [Pseudomonas syringae pv. tagetis]|uniref:hypothetical protein n=1 Tax=Pseudomonas syringae group genomosp. 7 TaxID=251699 RepID=UPI00376F8878
PSFFFNVTATTEFYTSLFVFCVICVLLKVDSLGIGIKTAQKRRYHRRTLSKARHKGRIGLGMGNVNAAHADQQKLAPN